MTEYQQLNMFAGFKIGFHKFNELFGPSTCECGRLFFVFCNNGTIVTNENMKNTKVIPLICIFGSR